MFSEALRIRRLDRAESHQFTYEYAQPEEYSFCQDSVIFPRFVAEQLASLEITENFKALDVCAGCGVIGFELAHHEPRLKKIDFIEVQDVFREPFERNLVITSHSPEGFRFLQTNYDVLQNDAFRSAYDLIVANPPYFLPGEGRFSPSPVKNRCRFFIDSSQMSLILGLVNALKPTGRAYLLMKSGEKHGRKLMREISLWLKGSANASVAADLRGTLIIEIRK